MTTAVRERPAHAGPANGGVPARRAVIRWAWRMFRREWRQQLLVLALIIVAVASVFVGAAVATDTPPSPDSGFGTAQDMVSLQGSPAQIARQLAAIQRRVRTTDVIENQTVAVPGSVDTYLLRAQNPHGPYGRPLLSLLSGHYPSGPGQVAVTNGVASDFHLRIGSAWHQGGATRRVTGIVQNPQSLLDEFALVVPGQVTTPTQVTVLFDAHGVRLSSLGVQVSTPRSEAASNPLNPETIVLALATLGMLLIALVAVGGFTVLAQRRLRSLGMLGSLGATDRHIRLVVRANGVVVGVVGTLAGGVLGLAAWLAYRPTVETDAHHEIGAFQLPWVVILLSMALAVVAAYFAASRPARAITRIPVVSALAGRPAPPKQVRRSAVPGVVLLAAAFLLVGYAASAGGNGNGQLAVVGGLICLVVAVILLSPAVLSLTGRLGGRAPIAVRLALRDLARYRARSGSALAAISIGVLIAVLISVEVASRFGNVLDYAGPNLTSSELAVYTAARGQQGPGPQAAPPNQAALTATAHRMAAALGTTSIVALESTSATLQHAALGRQYSGPLYVATPQLLHAFGIKQSQVSPTADVLTMRPGLSSMAQMQIIYGNYFTTPHVRGTGAAQVQTFACPPGQCLANPVIQAENALPSGTSAPNTVITEHALQVLKLRPVINGWLITTPHGLTPAQISSAKVTAAAAGMSVETRSSIPQSSTIINWATVFGVFLALAILAMTVGLIRSEAASDLRTLAATGASGAARRTLTAATAGALAFLGAVLGTAAAYVGAIGYARSSDLDGLSSLGNVPVSNLVTMLVIMPLAAAAIGWALSGRDQSAMGRKPIE